MRKKLLFLLGVMTAATAVAGDNGYATVRLPENAPGQIIVSHALIDNMVKAHTRTDINFLTDTVTVNGGSAEFEFDWHGPERYYISFGDGVTADFFAAPGEVVDIQVESLSPFKWKVSGTPLMEDIMLFNSQMDPFEEEYAAMAASGRPTDEDIQEFMSRYEAAVADFIKANPRSEAVAYALLNTQGEPFMEAYAAMTPEAKQSILMPFVEQQAERVRENIEMEKRREAMTSGAMQAPGFTLKDLEGKNVSLSDFRGKWVVLDFWGSWCGWCIKGMPALKEAYKQYAGQLEVIGIDCNESEAAWRAGVAKYELPWVNVYNDQKDGKLLKEYCVEGFPTKAIVNPEGILVDVTVGENPAFFTKLANFINGSSRNN